MDDSIPWCCQNGKRCLDPACACSQLQSQRHTYPARVPTSTGRHSRVSDCAASNTACNIPSHGSFVYHAPRQFTQNGCHTVQSPMTGRGRHQYLTSPSLHVNHNVMNTIPAHPNNKQKNASTMAPQFRRQEGVHHTASYPGVEHGSQHTSTWPMNFSSPSPLFLGQGPLTQPPTRTIQDHNPSVRQHGLPDSLSLSQYPLSYPGVPTTGYPCSTSAPLQDSGFIQQQIQAPPQEQATRVASSSDSSNIPTPALTDTTPNGSIETPPSSLDAVESWEKVHELQYGSNEAAQKYKAILPSPASIDQHQPFDDALPPPSFGLEQSDWQSHFDGSLGAFIRQPDAAPWMEASSTGMLEAAQMQPGSSDAFYNELFDFNAFDSFEEAIPSAYPPPDVSSQFMLQPNNPLADTYIDPSAFPDPLLPSMPTMLPMHHDINGFPSGFDLSHPYDTPTYAFPTTPLPPTPALGEGTRRDTTRDSELLTLRQSGLSYRQIKKDYGFKEAESTLRGRFRTLTKPKGSRVRKPGWGEETVSRFLALGALFALFRCDIC